MERKEPWFSKKYILLFIPLMLFWIILTPAVSLQSVIIGALVCLFVVYITRDISFTEKEMPIYSFKKFMLFIRFMLILMVEIVKANIDVAKIVLNPSLPISPCIVRVPMMLKNDVNKVIYANAITLTPGTMTIDINEKEFVIHALTEAAAMGTEYCFIERYTVKIEEVGK